MHQRDKPSSTKPPATDDAPGPVSGCASRPLTHHHVHEDKGGSAKLRVRGIWLSEMSNCDNSSELNVPASHIRALYPTRHHRSVLIRRGGGLQKWIALQTRITPASLIPLVSTCL